MASVLSLILVLIYFIPYKKFLFPVCLGILILPFLVPNPHFERLKKNIVIFREVPTILRPQITNKTRLTFPTPPPENMNVNILFFNNSSRAEKISIISPNKKSWELEYPPDKISTLCIGFCDNERSERWLYQINPVKGDVPELIESEALTGASFSGNIYPVLSRFNPYDHP